MVKTTFSYTEEALTDFFVFHLKRKDKIRWVYYGIALVFIIAGILLTFVFKKYVMGAVVIIASMIMVAFFPSQVKRAARRTMNSRYKREPQNIIFKEERIEQHLEKQILVYKWDLIKEVDETPKYIYFYINKKSAIIVSKDCITQDEYNEIVELIKLNKKTYYRYNRV